MATATETVTRLEKLKPATSLGGLIAEVAEVTRFYEVDTDTDIATEYGKPIINVLWGLTVQDKLADLATAKTEAGKAAAAKAAELDALVADLSAADAIVVP